jgi:hypothetical protein
MMDRFRKENDFTEASGTLFLPLATGQQVAPSKMKANP